MYTISLNHCLHQSLISQPDFLHTNFLFLIKIKAEHISFFQMEIIQIRRKLLFAPLIVCISMPDF